MNYKTVLTKTLRNKLTFLAFSVIFLSLSITSFVYASTDLYTTTNGYVTQLPYENLCWAASSVSMIQTKGISTSVTTHAAKALGSFSDVGRTATNINNDFSKIYGISTSLASVASFSSVQSYMVSNKPIMALIYWRSGGGHAMVISGTDRSAYSLRIMDPYYGWQYPSYSTFVNNYQGAGNWRQSIKYN